MENNINEIMDNEEVTDVTTEIVEANSGTALKTLVELGLIGAAVYGTYKLAKFIIKKIKAKKEELEYEEKVIDEPVEDDSDVEEDD